MPPPPFLPTPPSRRPRDDQEFRILRHRLDAHALAMDRAAANHPPHGAARMVVSIYDGGAMPSLPDKVYLGHPVQMDGDEREGATYTPWVDTDVSVPVVVLWNKPDVGDMLVATAVGGRWVAERSRPATPSYPCFCANMPTDVHVTDSILFPGGLTATYLPAESTPDLTTWLATGTYAYPGDLSGSCPPASVPVEYRLVCSPTGMGFFIHSYFGFVNYEDPFGPFNCPTPPPVGTPQEVGRIAAPGTLTCDPFLLSGGVDHSVSGGYYAAIYPGGSPVITWTR